MRVLVTGASGFFGRHLVPHLTAQGHVVRAAGRRGGTPTERCEPVTIPDLLHSIDWSRHVDGMDAVVHLAGIAHVRSSLPSEVYEQVNRHAAVALAKAAYKAGARFVFMSSVAAQSAAASERVLTEDSFEEPETPYGWAKRRAEEDLALCSANYVILRPTLAYGVGVAGNMRRIMTVAMAPLPPPLGAIRNRRSLLAIETMCDAVSFSLEKDVVRNQTLLLADARPVSTATIVECIRAGAGRCSKPLPVPEAVLRTLLRAAGQASMWNRLGGNLEVSVERLASLGFQWRMKTEDALFRLGALARRAAL